MGEDFKKAVTAEDHFQWRNDQPAGHTPKWGFIGEVPGASLQFVIDTTATNAVEGKDHAALTLSYLRSYEGMGRAGECAGPLLVM